MTSLYVTLYMYVCTYILTKTVITYAHTYNIINVNILYNVQLYKLK